MKPWEIETRVRRACEEHDLDPPPPILGDVTEWLLAAFETATRDLGFKIEDAQIQQTRAEDETSNLEYEVHDLKTEIRELKNQIVRLKEKP
jgi:septal ring factor EnvC (AmiA/AmiB activator)